MSVSGLQPMTTKIDYKFLWEALRSKEPSVASAETSTTVRASSIEQKPTFSKEQIFSTSIYKKGTSYEVPLYKLNIR